MEHLLQGLYGVEPLAYNNVGTWIFQLNLLKWAAGAGQAVDGPSNGSAPLPWDIRCNPTQMFHTEVRHLEVPHTATISVRSMILL